MLPMATVGNDQVVKPAWLPEGLYQFWFDTFVEAGGVAVQGSAEYATEFVRNSAEYDVYFPGIRRDDGSLRYSTNPEATYFNNIQSFRNTIEGVGLNPDLFEEEYIDVIRGDKSPLEFSQNVNTMYSRILSQGSAIRDEYSRLTGIEMTNEAILASIMVKRIENAVLNRDITMAEIGGEAAMKDFDITTQFVEMLEQQGMDRSEAQRFFGTAEAILPVLNSLAQRHGDPDDDFDLMELAQASVFLDAGQQKRISQLVSQEEAMFTGGAQVELMRTEAGGLGGLEAV
jgi:hypothetical protein